MSRGGYFALAHIAATTRITQPNTHKKPDKDLRAMDGTAVAHGALANDPWVGEEEK